jgi:hypothetical protein
MKRIVRYVISSGADPPPFELIKALAGREFHMSPQEVEDHPVDTLFESFAILSFFDTQMSKKKV